MTEPQRLLNAGDEVESALLASAKGDTPSKQAVTTTLVALGLGAGLAMGAGTASAATAASMAPSATAATAGKAGLAGKAGMGVVVKWVGIASIGALALWGASQLAASDEAAPPEPIAMVPAPAADEAPAEPKLAEKADEQAESPAGAEAASADDADQSEASNDEADEPTQPAKQSGSTPHVAGAPKAGSSPKASAPSASTGDASHLGDEVAALDSARKAMADDPDKALEAIEQYQDRFEGGVLGQEAEVLRIEALAKAGKVDQARALGQTFLAKHPSSPLAKRVRSVLSGASGN